MADKTISKLVHWGLCDGIGIEQHLSYRREIKDTVERVINRVKKKKKKTYVEIMKKNQKTYVE